MALEFTPDGYLKNWADWTPALRDHIAVLLSLELSPLHCQVIDLARSYFEAHNRLPAMRIWVKYCQTHLDPSLDSIQLHQLFLGKPLSIISKLGGLPKPLHCL